MTLVGPNEAAELLCVSRQRLYKIIAAAPDFPEPEARLRGGPVWRAAQIERWATKHGRTLAGR